MCACMYVCMYVCILHIIQKVVQSHNGPNTYYNVVSMSKTQLVRRNKNITRRQCFIIYYCRIYLCDACSIQSDAII